MTLARRTILLGVGTAFAAAVGLVACSAPVSEAQGRGHAMTNAFDARGSASESVSEQQQKARTSETSKESRADALRGRCPSSMVEIEGRFCIDRWEASLVDVLSNGEERAHSPFLPVDDVQHVRAVSTPNVFPQGYISAVEASQACNASGKRLCRVNEWGKACRGPASKPWGYGDRREPGRCNDRGKNPVISLYGRGHWNWSTMNQPELNQQQSTLARTGEHDGCTNDYGVFDMVGNLHEWVADPSGTFYGGYYQDVSSVGHGEGCGYLTTAHEARYHDYSTGFRCCSDVAGSAPSPVSTPPAKRPSRARH